MVFFQSIPYEIDVVYQQLWLLEIWFLTKCSDIKVKYTITENSCMRLIFAEDAPCIGVMSVKDKTISTYKAFHRTPIQYSICFLENMLLKIYALLNRSHLSDARNESFKNFPKSSNLPPATLVKTDSPI